MAQRLVEERARCFAPMPYHNALAKGEMTLDEVLWLDQHARLRVEPT